MEDDRSGKLVARWRQGDQEAAAELFRRYANRLIALARSRLSARLAQRVDPEDIVQSVYRSFFDDARNGHYDIQRGGDLWQLLVSITLHKLSGQVKRNTRKKRSMDLEQNFGSEDSLVHIQSNLQAREPSPVEAVALTEQIEQLMRDLPPLHRQIIELRLQGHNVFTIADRTNAGERTVRRVLQRVKQQLEQWDHDDRAS